MDESALVADLIAAVPKSVANGAVAERTGCSRAKTTAVHLLELGEGDLDRSRRDLRRSRRALGQRPRSCGSGIVVGWSGSFGLRVDRQSWGKGLGTLIVVGAVAVVDVADVAVAVAIDADVAGVQLGILGESCRMALGQTGVVVGKQRNREDEGWSYSIDSDLCFEEVHSFGR